MNSSSLKEYLRHYGRIRSLRGSVIRSTFKRVTAAFDEFSQEQADSALKELILMRFQDAPKCGKLNAF